MTHKVALKTAKPAVEQFTVASAFSLPQKKDALVIPKALSGKGKKNTPIARFQDYVTKKRLTLEECGPLDQDYSGCQDHFTYHPNLDSPQTCGQVKKDLNITDKDFCADDEQLLVLPKAISVDDMKKYLGLK